MVNRIVLVSHSAPIKDDRASDQLALLGYDLDWRTPCLGDALDPLGDDVAGTVVYGGGYAVSEIPDRDFLQEEIKWLKACMAANLPVLGICQGAQMIAHILGAEVGPHPQGLHEFGYYPVNPTADGVGFLPDTLHMAQSHYHGFGLPKGAVQLAGSAVYPNQAFSFGPNVYGLQFHAEVTRPAFRRWQDRNPDIYAQPGVQDRDTQDTLGEQHDAAMDQWFRDFLVRLFGPAT